MRSLPPPPAWLARVLESRHFRFGLPFVVLVVGAPFVLKDLNQVRYEYTGQKKVIENINKTADDLGLKRRPTEELTIENLHKETEDKYQSEDYAMVRGPRPWETDSELHQAARANKKIKAVVKGRQDYGI